MEYLACLRYPHRHWPNHSPSIIRRTATHLSFNECPADKFPSCFVWDDAFSTFHCDSPSLFFPSYIRIFAYSTFQSPFLFFSLFFSFTFPLSLFLLPLQILGGRVARDSPQNCDPHSAGFRRRWSILVWLAKTAATRKASCLFTFASDSCVYWFNLHLHLGRFSYSLAPLFVALWLSSVLW